MSVRFLPGLCSVTFRDRTPSSIVEIASDAGLAAIEWGADVHVPPGRLDTAREVSQRTREAGLTVCSYGSYLRPPGDTIDAFHRVLETARELGAPMIRIWPGWQDRVSTDYSAADRRATVDAITAMGAAAQAHDVAIGLEFHPGTLTDSTASAVQLMQAIDSPAVFLYWQPRPGIPQAEALVELAAVRTDIAFVHVFHWDADCHRFPLAEGAADWRAYFAAIPDGRFAGQRYALLEFVADDSVGNLKSDAKALKALLAEAASGKAISSSADSAPAP
ncbi:MAG: sugar phosphate isomerase/epimerase family protein [Pseudomonadota bacterium]